MGTEANGMGAQAGMGRVRAFFRDFEWPLVGTVAAIAAVLGHFGYMAQFAAEQKAYGFFDIVYLDLQLFIIQMGDVEPPFHWMLNVARFLAPAASGYAALQALAALLAEQFLPFRLRLMRDHAVICGLGRKGMALVKGFLAEGRRVVVIEQDEENDFVRQCRDLGALVLIGDMTSPQLLRQAGLDRARYQFALAGEDGTNVEVAVSANDLLRGRRTGRPLTCMVHVFDAQLCQLLRERELGGDSSPALRLEFFNVFDAGARVLLEEFPPPVSGPEGEGPVAVVGVGRLGESLIVTLARQRYMAERAGGAAPLRVLLVDLDATSIARSMQLRYPQLGKVCDLVPFDLDVRSPGFQSAEFLRAEAAGGRASVYVCLDDDSFCLSAALALVNPLREVEPTIVVRMAENAGLATLLQGVDEGSFRYLRSFGLLDRTCQPDVVLQGTHEIIARAMHEEYLRQQKAAGATIATNPALVPWPDLSEELRESNRQQADHLGVKLKATGCGLAPLTDWDQDGFTFTDEEIEKLARLEHDRWMEEKRRAGYRPGPVKDAEKKTHPCLVPYDELPEDEKEKDRHPVRRIPHFLAQVGFRLFRLKRPAERPRAK